MNRKTYRPKKRIYAKSGLVIDSKALLKLALWLQEKLVEANTEKSPCVATTSITEINEITHKKLGKDLCVSAENKGNNDNNSFDSNDKTRDSTTRRDSEGGML